MAIPTTPQKRLMAAGAKKASTWGTAVALGALNGLDILSDGGLERKQSYLPAKGHDLPFVKEGDLGLIQPVDFTPTFEMRYDPGALGTLMALLFGTAGTPAQQGTTAAYKHTLQWKDVTDGLFATFAIERMSKVFEVASAKPFALELGLSDALVTGSISLRGNTLIDDSAVNGATQMDALTYRDRENRVKFVQGVFKMNAQAGGNVENETALEVNGMTLTFQRALDAKHVAGIPYIVEPLEEDFPLIQVKLTFPRMSNVNKTYFQTFTAETEQKMLIKFTGPLIESTYYYTLAFFYPRLRITEVKYADDEIIPAEITLAAEEAASAPTGMSYTRPYIELINKQTTDYLA